MVLASQAHNKMIKDLTPHYLLILTLSIVVAACAVVDLPDGAGAETAISGSVSLCPVGEGATSSAAAASAAAASAVAASAAANSGW